MTKMGGKTYIISTRKKNRRKQLERDEKGLARICAQILPEFCPNIARILPDFCPNIVQNLPECRYVGFFFFWGGGGTVPLPPPPPSHSPMITTVFHSLGYCKRYWRFQIHYFKTLYSPRYTWPSYRHWQFSQFVRNVMFDLLLSSLAEISPAIKIYDAAFLDSDKVVRFNLNSK